MSPRIERRRQAIETIHQCTARDVTSEPVVELFRGKVAWDGVVETYELQGHPKAKRFHAWTYDESGEAQYVTVLESPPVDSVDTAVKVAIAAKARNRTKV